MANSSPFASLALQRAATFSFALVDEVHSLVDEPVHVSRRLHRRVKQLGVFGLILFGTLISTLGKLGTCPEVAQANVQSISDSCNCALEH